MSFAPGPSRHPIPRSLQGTKPGLLDPTQPARILRIPGSSLAFAAFDPLTACGHFAQSRNRAHDAEFARPKRIVIEIPPRSGGTSRWRYVPRARRAPGVEDEGVWPRRVVLCGEYVVMTEDQWDIYKLDPAYDCFVPDGSDPVISHKDPNTLHEFHSRTSGPRGQEKKRRLSSPSGFEEHHPSLHKKFRTVVTLVSDEEDDAFIEEEVTETDDEEEVEEIVVEESPKKDQRSSERVKQERKKAREERAKDRREKIKTKTGPSFESTRPRTPEVVDLTMEDITPPDLTPPNGGPIPGPTKRKAFTGAESPEEVSPTREPGFQPNKRARTRSPGASRTGLNGKRSDRGRRRMAQTKEHLQDIQEVRVQQFWQEIIAGIPGGIPTPPSSQPQPNEPQPSEEDLEHQAAIEESRRKLAELERDRPLWEHEASKRSAQEAAEEMARRARKEAERRHAAEAALHEERQRQRAEAAAAQAEQRARAEKARIEREHRRRERERWSYGLWTTTRAIERYRVLCESFDVAKFTAENPAEFEMIPWPVLHSPVTLRVEDIDWASVESFFEAARRHMRSQDYKAFVEKSHKRFHPDRWRARGVLKSIADEELRGSLEVAANTVAQALTPIWRDMRG